MVQLNFNATQVAPNTAMEPVPSGNYPVIITNSQKKPTSKGDGAYIELEMTIQGGEFAGRKLFDRLNIENPNKTAEQIAYSTLSAICHVTGRMNITMTEQLHGVPFIAVAIKKPRNDQPDVMTNEVKGYKDIQGNDPGKAPGNTGGAGNQQGGPAWGNNSNMQGGQNNGGGQNWQGQDPNQNGWGGGNGQPQNGQNAGWQGNGNQQGGGNQGQAPQGSGQGGQGSGNGQQLDPNAPPPWAQG